MVYRNQPIGWFAAVTAIAVALGAGVFFGPNHANAQGTDAPKVGRRGPGGPGGPGFGRGGPGGPGGLAGLPLHRLDLSDAQRDQVHAVLDKQREGQRALGERAAAAHEALETALVNTPLDEGAIRSAAAAASAVDADMAVARGRLISEVLQILTAEQQAKVKAFQTERRERIEKMRERRQERK